MQEIPYRGAGPIPTELTLMHQQNQLLARIANSLETLAAIAQAEHEASDTIESGEAFDLSGRPV